MTTRTLNPLPFEHLEPKRFEDLVRALLYDFRSWLSLEATGRSGGDGGFDVLGRESVGTPNATHDDETEDGDSARPERVWLVQCKREKTIGPTAIRRHLKAIPESSYSNLYGFIFVAACNLSLKTRQACREWCQERGVSEVHVWSVAEIEDLLLQPRNDHLLFAFFGLSLQIRKSSLQSALRRNTTLKRKILRVLPGEGWPGTPMLLRDPNATNYPEQGERELPHVALISSPVLWRPCCSGGVGVSGLRVVVRCCPGFLDLASQSWDMASAADRACPEVARETWSVQSHPGAEIGMAEWRGLRGQFRGHLYVVAELPYDEILEIDEVGDPFWKHPTVYTHFVDGRPQIGSRADIYFQFSNFVQKYRLPRGRGPIPVFSRAARDEKWEPSWLERNGVTLAASLPDGIDPFGPTLPE